MPLITMRKEDRFRHLAGCKHQPPAVRMRFGGAKRSFNAIKRGAATEAEGQSKTKQQK